MILYYVRHGDPIYDPDSLTPLGRRQAEAVAKRLSLYGLDEIYCSTSNRAIETAMPTCEILNIKPKTLEFANEIHAWRELTIKKENGDPLTWFFNDRRYMELFNTKEMRDLGDRWFEHPALSGFDYGKGIKRIYDDTDAFFESLGYVHNRFTGKYEIKEANHKRIAFFAHQGFGLAFLSCLLDIPYPAFCSHFDMCHTGVTVIEFPHDSGYTIPKILTLSNDSHIYREGLPTKYSNYIYI